MHWKCLVEENYWRAWLDSLGKCGVAPGAAGSATPEMCWRGRLGVGGWGGGGSARQSQPPCSARIRAVQGYLPFENYFPFFTLTGVKT